MDEINITELRQNLPAYIDKVRRGGQVDVTVRGKVVARIVPVTDERAAARARLVALRARARLGDVVTPVDEDWEAAR
jgi:prevent-host-death family protein